MQWELFAAAATSPAQRVPCLQREKEEFSVSLDLKWRNMMQDIKISYIYDLMFKLNETMR